MCGIVGFTGRENALPILIKGLYSLEYRGYDSAGIAAFTRDGLRVVKTQGRIANLEEKIREEGGLDCTCGIGHTRWATHGEPSDRNSHPHLGGRDGKGKVAVVHNGIIENYKELRESLEAHGYTFQSETDTETVAHLVDYLHTGKQEDLAQTVLNAVQRIRGSYALGVVSMDNPEEIVAARRDNPLVIGIGEGENMIASDITAIISRTKQYIILDDNEVAIVRPDSVIVMNEFGDVVEKTVQTVSWDLSAAEKGGYQHFMLKEIMEQPKAVADTVKPRIQGNSVVFEDNGLTDERLREIENIHIIGCGSALHAGMVGKRVIEAMCRIRCTAEVASEFRYENPIIGKKDMCIVISQSGETADTLAAMRLAKQAGAFTIAVVNVVSSTIAREADGVLYTWAGPEIAVDDQGVFRAAGGAVSDLGQDRTNARPDLDRRRARAVRRAAAPAGVYRKGARMPAGYAAHCDAVRQPAERVLPRPRAGLRGGARGLAQAQGDLLYPFRGLCGGRAQARHDLADRGGDAGCCARDPACAV